MIMGMPLSASPKKGGTGFEPGKETDKFYGKRTDQKIRNNSMFIMIFGGCLFEHFYEAFNGYESGTDRQTDGWGNIVRDLLNLFLHSFRSEFIPCFSSSCGDLGREEGRRW